MFENMFHPMMDEEAEFIPLLSAEDEENIASEKLPDILPILPLRNTVIFPGVVIPITVGRDKSIALIKDAYKNKDIIGVVAQKDEKIEDPLPSDIYTIGTSARILKLLRMPDGNTTVILQGRKKIQIKNVIQTEPYFKAEIIGINDNNINLDDPELIAIISSIKEVANKIIKQSPNIPSEASFAINNIESPTFLVSFIASHMNISLADKQQLLEITDLKNRSLQLLSLLNKELNLIELKNKIQDKTRSDIDKQQREYFLSQQLKTIQEELGGSYFEQEIKEFEEKAKTKKWNETTKAFFEKNLNKLKRMNPNSPEYGITAAHLELLLDLPWNEYTEDIFDIPKAQAILDEDHFGLEKVKERILEYLAVIKLKQDLKSPILCLYGPPGVGKTSLGKSIARALGRKYVRMSLGGLHDESEIRGHRKTYIGAMPGRIIQNIRKAGSANPVFVLDEIDKIGRDFQGDPASALLEVLDPEQNNSFYDNYLETEFDLSKVLFIATCNDLSTIHPALLDRFEIINVTGYSTEEKLEIAKKFLIPKISDETGIKKQQLKLTDAVIEEVIENYTFESGVRNLEKRLSKIARHIALKISKNEDIPKITKEYLPKIFGPTHIKEKYENNNDPGVVPGLAWTPNGGEILYIETVASPAKETNLTLTGNLGNVMKESATIALEYIKSHAKILGINEKDLEGKHFHMHIPEGAVPKDGPSAGIAMIVSLISCITQKKVKKYLSMTGEITLRGKLLPVGGIKEKILAAKRAGIKEIILCKANEQDVLDIPSEYLKGLKFSYVENIPEAVKIAF
ncbi:MAG: endopeptidase La [Bacteroidia bacterium]|nr:endopeptidase La [Bacteroidia bacterium]